MIYGVNFFGPSATTGVSGAGSTVTPTPSTTPKEPCQNKTFWSPWINRQSPGNGGEVEKMTETEKKAFCPEGVINGVDCETITGQPWFDTNQILTCDVRDGLNCDNSINFGDLCKDYRIRYQCQVICKGKFCKALNYQFFKVNLFLGISSNM